MAACVADGGSLNFGGGTLSVQVITNVSAEDWLGIQPPATNSTPLGLDGNTVTWSGANLANFQGGSAGNALVFSLTTNATSVSLTALLQQVAFASSDTNDGVKVVEVPLTYAGIGVTASRVVSLDQPPVVGDPDIWATAAATITVPKSWLLAAATSPNGDTLTLGRATAADGAVLDSGTNLLYQSFQWPNLIN
jgi:hypothetical protein